MRLATRSAAIQALGELSQPEARYLSRKLAPKTQDDDRPSPAAITKGDQPDYLPDPIHAELKERICDLQTYADALGDHARRRAPRTGSWTTSGAIAPGTTSTRPPSPPESSPSGIPW